MFTAAIITLSRIFVAIAAAGLLAMMFLTAFDVVMRYVFNQPVRGAMEVVEYLMAIVVSFSIAWCAHEKAHVSVDLFMTRFSGKVQALVHIFTSCIAMLFVFFMTWHNILHIKDVYASNITSAVLGIPVYPFMGMMSLGLAGFSLILLKHMLDSAWEVFKQ